MNRFEKFRARALKDKKVRAAYEEGIDRLRLGVEIAKLRANEGLSQTKLAAMIDSSQAVVSRLENGGNVEIYTLYKILDALGAEIAIVRPNGRQRHRQLSRSS